MAVTFQDLGVAKWLVEALTAMKIYTPTAIQAACIPKVLNGHDCIGGAQTGSGKTIAFAAPMLTRWSENPSGVFGLVLTPTRELAYQIAEQFQALGANANLKVIVIVGGEDMTAQTLELAKCPHFVIATPGRLADHILSSGEDVIRGLRRVKYLVLDEADRLLTNSFADHLDTCFSALPPPSQRQNMLFTATVTDSIRAIKEKPVAAGKPEFFIHEVDTVDKVAIPSTLSISYIFLPSNVKAYYLHCLMTLEEHTNKSAIIFVNRTYTAELITRTLSRLGLNVTSLNSDLKQADRTSSYHRFKSGAARILVATDVASRGLDIPQVALVVNYDLPADPDDYIHRVGRTARAGRKGESISLVSEKDIERVLAIEERVGKKMEKYEEVSENKVIANSMKVTSVALREAEMEMEKAENTIREKKKINKRKHASEFVLAAQQDKRKVVKKGNLVTK
ncbi:hypothetical protein BABINDRAFT_160813 [Babjeviella inositovora NRRL Y-12698]|uniref:ATP-dependent RNA helicase DBP8 n=1 Tax=Babjeviella inositovora NRRL Y-12698 TaxID=984486 RepID=A0A1E3QU53_9ASCO|nr:uncharacterized protein BABINDRAFT_160813 [Babjeviella inositovora NRRL Y-12698]ODQ80542.1 hypothetical protein BABINDRAFT_160813 [Babjeviella inositovora NRRL Y-12698]